MASVRRERSAFRVRTASSASLAAHPSIRCGLSAAANGGKCVSTTSRTTPDVDSEVLVDEDVPKASNLRPRALWVHPCDRDRQVIRCLTDDLKITFDRIQRHACEPWVLVQNS